MGQTDSCQRGRRGGAASKKLKALAERHIYITHRLRHQRGDSQEEKGGGD